MGRQQKEVATKVQAMESHQTATDQKCLQRCEEVMRRMGVIRDLGLLKKEKLPPLPNEDSPKFRHEVELYAARVQKTPAGRMVNSLMGMRVGKCSDGQKDFANNLSKLLDMETHTWLPAFTGLGKK